MRINNFIENINRQLELIKIEFENVVGEPLANSDKNEDLLARCQGLLTQAKAQLLMLEIEDRRHEKMEN